MPYLEHIKNLSSN